MSYRPITAWSYNRLKDFEQCKLKAQLKHGMRIPEPERPLPPGKSEHANDRGTRIHTAAEMFVRSEGPFAHEMKPFQPEFEAMQRLYGNGVVSLEGDWAMDRDWAPVEWRSPEAWLRLKLDAIVFLSDEEAVVIDYKTGKRFGNEVAHGQQTQLYQLVSFLRYPKLEVVHTELWYLDQNDMATHTYRRHQGIRFRDHWNSRADKMTTAVEFPPNPNVFSCQYCPYGPWENGTGHCTKGVKR